jgi:cytoskeletal protein RodZ
MYKSIGEALQQARKSLGISLEEVSQKTNIRVNYLESMEQGTFRIPLSEVYRRGFLKNYARLLKLNPQTLLNEYSNKAETHLHGNESGLIVSEKTEIPVPTGPNSDPTEEGEGLSDIGPSSVKKIIVGVLCMFLLIAALGVLRRSKPRTPLEVVEVLPQPATDEGLTIIALEDVQVFVRQEGDKRRLLAETIAKGMRRKLEKSGPIEISYSDGSSLLLETPNGGQIKPQKAGPGWITVP